MSAPGNLLEALKTPVAGVPAWVLVALALALPLAVVAFKWLQARAGKRNQEKARAPDSTPAPVAHPPTNRLWVVWRRFLSQLTPTYRRSILQFQPFLVMGTAASGKSQLIDTCTDWRRLERQLAGGHVDDADLRISLASQALLFELPQPVLQDTSSNGREALLRLWKPLFHQRKPLVVVTLNAVTLASLPPDTLRDQADRLRGKLNLLAEVCRSPIEVRLVLTHMDLVRGYTRFARLLSGRGASAALTFEPTKPDSEVELERALRERFKTFEKLLPLALTGLTNEDNLEVTAFLREGPAALRPVSPFIAALCAHNPRAPLPRLERVYLSAPPQLGGGANPFHASRDEATRRAPHPLWGHLVAAAALAALGLLYLTAGYRLDRKLWKPAAQALAQYNDQLPVAEQLKLLEPINAFSARHVSGPMRFFPSFFSFQDEEIEQRLAREIRVANLLKALKELDKVPDDQQPHLRGLYLLAVLYATRGEDNALHQLILKYLEEWAEATQLPPELIKAYVLGSGGLDENTEKPGLEHLRSAPAWDASNLTEPWLRFFHQLEQDLDRGHLEPAQVRQRQQQAEELLGALRVIRRYAHSQEILDRLEEHTTLELKSGVYANALPAVKATQMFGDSIDDVERLLTEVSQGALGAQEPEARLLSQLNAQLRQALEAARPPEQPARDVPPSEAGQQQVLRIQVGTKMFTLSLPRWRALILDSTTSERIRRFLGRGVSSGSIFFSGQETLPPLELNALGEGGSLFPGRATVNGRNTRLAFEEYVRAPLVTYVELADKLQAAQKLDAKERTRLERFLVKQVRQYARCYANSMDDYYRSFSVRARSVPELQVVLERMQDDSSVFTQFLREVGENTALPLDGGSATARSGEVLRSLLEPLRQELAHYTSLHRLMGTEPAADGTPASDGEAKPSGKNAGELRLEAYRTRLGILSQALAGQAPGAPAPEEKKEDGEAEVPAEAAPQKGLRERLSPAGQLTLDILLDNHSYDTLIHDWLEDVGLDDRLRKPFLAPVELLRSLGRQEIETTVATLWRDTLLPELGPVLSAFPFDPTSSRDATPEQLQALFHPRKGRFHQLTRQLVGPLSQYSERRGWKKRPTYGALSLPVELYPALNTVQRLTDSLWDARGNPVPLRLEVTPVPFEAANARALLTLAYLTSGTSSLVYFNQRPTPQLLAVDWTKRHQATVGIEAMDRSTGARVSPQAQRSDMSYWALLHLLRRGTREGNVWTWRINLPPSQQDRGASPALPVSFQLESGPWALFELLPSAPAALSEAHPTGSKP